MKGLLAVLLLTCVPATALAQPAVVSPGDVAAAQAEVDQDYAQALAADCSTACRALDSMRHATERLCALDPGDRCSTARKKLGDATARVHSACPACGEALGQEKEPAAPRPAPPPAEASGGTLAVQNESVERRGGCAGCATASASSDAVAPLALAGLFVLALRRRRR